MRIAVLALAVIATGLAGCTETAAQRATADRQAAADQAGLSKTLAGLVPGRTSTCLDNIESRNAQQVKAYGPTIIYSISDAVKYRTDTAGGCENIARGDILVTVSNSGQLCRGDIARTVDQTSHFPTGSCAMGDFVRYERPRGS